VRSGTAPTNTFSCPGFWPIACADDSWIRSAARSGTFHSTTNDYGGPVRATGSGRRSRSIGRCCPSWFRLASRWGRSHRLLQKRPGYQPAHR
jgi:hypothetical protein